MKDYATAATAMLIVMLVYAGVMFGASFAGLTGDGPMVPTAVLALLTWGAFIVLLVLGLVRTLAVLRGESQWLAASVFWKQALPVVGGALSIVTAFAFGFGAFASCGPVWLSGLYHWGGLVGSALCFGVWFVAPRFASNLPAGGPRMEPHSARKLIVTTAVVYGVWGVIWFGAWMVLRGSIDSASYPSATNSPYRLPYPDGDRSWIVQGNNSHLNHNEDEEFAWDFRRQCGTPVLAARAGTVTRVDDTHDGNGKGKPNNRVEVTHSDGTVGRYIHISKGSAKVSTGDTVKQGDTLALVGNVGNSLTGHIHFDVEKGGVSIPVTFRDVDEDKGIPRTFERYASAD